MLFVLQAIGWGGRLLHGLSYPQRQHTFHLRFIEK